LGLTYRLISQSGFSLRADIIERDLSQDIGSPDQKKLITLGILLDDILLIYTHRLITDEYEVVPVVREVLIKLFKFAR